MKTHCGAKKRFRKTANGKLRGRRAYSSHILEKKSPKRKRRMARPVEIAPAGQEEGREAAAGERGPMSRATNAVARKRRKKKVLKQAKGY